MLLYMLDPWVVSWDVLVDLFGVALCWLVSIMAQDECSREGSHPLCELKEAFVLMLAEHDTNLSWQVLLFVVCGCCCGEGDK